MVSEGIEKYDADVKFIVKNPQDQKILQKIESVTGLKYRKTLRIRELPPGKNIATLMEKIILIPGVALSVDMEGCVRQGPYINSHKLYARLFSREELEAVKQKKRQLRNNKDAYKEFKYQTRAELIKRAVAAKLI